MGKVIDLVGQKFGRWTVLGIAESPTWRKRWLCECECGTTQIVLGSNLRNGKSRSCGCYRAEKGRRKKGKHGMSGSPIHRTWAGMIQRCENPNSKSFHDYGERGITICNRWHSFNNFFADMGERPEGHSIDRIDNDDGYHCGHCEECTAKGWKANCRWVTREVQESNTRRNRHLMLDGEKVTIAEYARRTGIEKSTIRYRIKTGKLQEAQ